MVEELELVQSVNIQREIIGLAAIFLVGMFLEFVVLRWLRHAINKEKWPMAAVVVDVLRGQALFVFTLLTILAGVVVFVQTPYPRTAHIIYQIILSFFILDSTIIVFTRVVNGWVNLYISQYNITSVSIVNNTISALVSLVAIILAMYALNVPITPWLTVVAGSSVGIAFALRDPLANLFAGVVLVASDRIHAGNYVLLSSGEEGYVTDIKWHTTTLRQLANNMVIVPNSVMVSATVINFDLPESEMSVLLDVGVSYDSDLDHVERVTIDVADEVMRELTGGVATWSSFIRYNAFADSSINFTVIMRAKEFVDKYLITHEFIRRLHRRYKDEGIVIPFPIRTIEMIDRKPLEIVQVPMPDSQQKVG